MINKLKFILTESEKRALAMLLAGTAILAVLETFGIGIIIPIMGLFVNRDKIHTSGFLNRLYRLTGGGDETCFLTMLIVTAIVLFAIKSAYTVFILSAQRKAVNDIRVRMTANLLGAYLNKPYAFHLENNSSILFKNVTTEVAQFCDNFLFSSVMVSAEAIILAAICILLLCVYPLATSLLICVLAVMIILSFHLLKNRIRAYSVQRTTTSDKVTKFGFEALQAVKEIKVYGAQDFFTKRYSEEARKYAESYVRFSVLSDMPRYMLETIIWSGALIALLISVYSNKTPAELIPMMTVFALAALRILPSVNRIYMHMNVIKYYSNGVDIIYNILKDDDSPGRESGENAVVSGDLAEESQDIRIENMAFQYRTAKTPIFNGLNIVIQKNTTVAFAGETGSGKSTLADILMGLLTPDSGALYYGRSSVTADNVSGYRSRIGYVPQHIFLIDDTLEANIAFGIPKDRIDKTRLDRAIRISQLENLVGEMPLGVMTKIGEKGVRLSGGQRQRVAIARALYHDPQVLIMDEATSALDGYTEAEVNKAIRNLCGKMTVIIIAHRLSTIECADIIYVMDQGAIVDRGTFKELLKESFSFKKIANQVDG